MLRWRDVFWPLVLAFTLGACTVTGGIEEADASGPMSSPDAGQKPSDAGQKPSERPDSAVSTDHDASIQEPIEKAAWTVLVYMAADNNLEKYAIEDLGEMLSATIADDINLIVQIDRAAGFYELGVGGLENFQTAKRLRVRGGKLEELEDLGEINTGDEKSLVSFLDWGLHAYPAERQILLFWNHGNAWQGYGGDDESHHDRLEQAELERAIQLGLEKADVGELDLIGFDACLMSTYVSAESLRAFSRYLLASEELEPGHGWNYRSGMNFLSQNLDATPVQWAEQLIEGFYEQARAQRTHSDITLNLLDLEQFPAVSTAFNSLVTAVHGSLSTRKTQLSKARARALQYGYHPDPARAYHMVDLGDLARQLADADSALAAQRDAVIGALSKLVVASRYGRTKQASSGVSIYFPNARGYYLNGYDAVREGVEWRELLKAFYAEADKDNAPPLFEGQKHAEGGAQAMLGFPFLFARAPFSLMSNVLEVSVAEPATADPGCDVSVGPEARRELQPQDVGKVASATLVAGLVHTRSGEIHLFRREPAALDAVAAEVTGAWDRHVLVANQGSEQALLFAEVKLSADRRFAYADVPALYANASACPCELPGMPGYSDLDVDGIADCADGDLDGDGVSDKGEGTLDNCPWIPNRNQLDVDGNGIGDACQANSGAPILACTPAATGEYGALDAAFWRVVVDRLNGEKYASTLYVATETGVSEVTPVSGDLLWPQVLVLQPDGSVAFRVHAPLPFNLQAPVDFIYEDFDHVYELNSAGAPALDWQLQPAKLIDKLGYGEAYMRVSVADFAGRGGVAETQVDVSACVAVEPPFCAGTQVPDCDGGCVERVRVIPNGACDDGTAGTANLNCKFHNYDNGECARPGCKDGYIRDCNGQCTLTNEVLGNGFCDALARCEALNYDGGDCPCGPDCSGNGSCTLDSCVCAGGFTGEFCETPPSCGNGTCSLELGETCRTCSADCGGCVNPCGDGVCSAKDGESCDSCSADCGSCACGDGQCSLVTEDCSSCAADCGSCPLCGDFRCDRYSATSPFGSAQGEGCASCPSDCGACAGDCCETGPTPGCSDPQVMLCVCDLSPNCCTGSWNGSCMEIARNQCGLSCAFCSASSGGDVDADFVCGKQDNCPLLYNEDQLDADGDGVGDACDICPDGDDRADPDRDGIPSACDVCPRKYNPTQLDSDGDWFGDACDNCPFVSNEGQADSDGDGIGDSCE